MFIVVRELHARLRHSIVMHGRREMPFYSGPPLFIVIH